MSVDRKVPKGYRKAWHPGYGPAWEEVSREAVDHRGDPIVGPLLTVCACGHEIELTYPGAGGSVICQCGLAHQLDQLPPRYEYVVMRRKK